MSEALLKPSPSPPHEWDRKHPMAIWQCFLKKPSSSHASPTECFCLPDPYQAQLTWQAVTAWNREEGVYLACKFLCVSLWGYPPYKILSPSWPVYISSTQPFYLSEGCKWFQTGYNNHLHPKDYNNHLPCKLVHRRQDLRRERSIQLTLNPGIYCTGISVETIKYLWLFVRISSKGLVPRGQNQLKAGWHPSSAPLQIQSEQWLFLSVLPGFPGQLSLGSYFYNLSTLLPPGKSKKLLSCVL